MSATADIDKLQRAKTNLRSIFEIAARADRAAIVVARLGLTIVLLWIGGLKIMKYEAVSIVPLVANSPLMSFFYADPGHYKAHMNPEGALVPANVQWHEKNHTYTFAYGLGAVIVLLGLLLCLHPWLPQLAALGGFLVFLMSFVTLSFLITTPECWVPPLGDVNHGFPFLSGGRAASGEGFHHDGCCPGRDGRFGEGLFAKVWRVRMTAPNLKTGS